MGDDALEAFGASLEAERPQTQGAHDLPPAFV